MTSGRVGSQVSPGLTAADGVTQHSPLGQLARRSAVTIEAGATLADAVAAMRAAGVSALLVADGGGIITERDVARAAGAGVPVEEVVERVATAHPLVVPASMPVVEACGVMLREEVRHLVIASDDGRLGVVSLRDIAAVLLRAVDPDPWLSSLRIAVEAPSEIWLG